MPMPDPSTQNTSIGSLGNLAGHQTPSFSKSGKGVPVDDIYKSSK